MINKKLLVLLTPLILGVNMNCFAAYASQSSSVNPSGNETQSVEQNSPQQSTNDTNAAAIDGFFGSGDPGESNSPAVNNSAASPQPAPSDVNQASVPVDPNSAGQADPSQNANDQSIPAQAGPFATVPDSQPSVDQSSANPAASVTAEQGINQDVSAQPASPASAQPATTTSDVSSSSPAPNGDDSSGDLMLDLLFNDNASDAPVQNNVSATANSGEVSTASTTVPVNGPIPPVPSDQPVVAEAQPELTPVVPQPAPASSETSPVVPANVTPDTTPVVPDPVVPAAETAQVQSTQETSVANSDVAPAQNSTVSVETQAQVPAATNVEAAQTVALPQQPAVTTTTPTDAQPAPASVAPQPVPAASETSPVNAEPALQANVASVTPDTTPVVPDPVVPAAETAQVQSAQETSVANSDVAPAQNSTVSVETQTQVPAATNVEAAQTAALPQQPAVTTTTPTDAQPAPTSIAPQPVPAASETSPVAPANVTPDTTPVVPDPVVPAAEPAQQENSTTPDDGQKNTVPSAVETGAERIANAVAASQENVGNQLENQNKLLEGQRNQISALEKKLDAVAVALSNVHANQTKMQEGLKNIEENQDDLQSDVEVLTVMAASKDEDSASGSDVSNDSKPSEDAAQESTGSAEVQVKADDSVESKASEDSKEIGREESKVVANSDQSEEGSEKSAEKSEKKSTKAEDDEGQSEEDDLADQKEFKVTSDSDHEKDLDKSSDEKKIKKKKSKKQEAESMQKSEEADGLDRDDESAEPRSKKADDESDTDDAVKSETKTDDELGETDKSKVADDASKKAESDAKEQDDVSDDQAEPVRDEDSKSKDKKDEPKQDKTEPGDSTQDSGLDKKLTKDKDGSVSDSKDQDSSKAEASSVAEGTDQSEGAPGDSTVTYDSGDSSKMDKMMAMLEDQSKQIEDLKDKVENKNGSADSVTTVALSDDSQAQSAADTQVNLPQYTEPADQAKLDSSGSNAQSGVITSSVQAQPLPVGTSGDRAEAVSTPNVVQSATQSTGPQQETMASPVEINTISPNVSAAVIPGRTEPLATPQVPADVSNTEPVVISNGNAVADSKTDVVPGGLYQGRPLQQMQTSIDPASIIQSQPVVANQVNATVAPAITSVQVDAGSPALAVPDDRIAASGATNVNNIVPALPTAVVGTQVVTQASGPVDQAVLADVSGQSNSSSSGLVTPVVSSATSVVPASPLMTQAPNAQYQTPQVSDQQVTPVQPTVGTVEQQSVVPATTSASAPIITSSGPSDVVAESKPDFAPAVTGAVEQNSVSELESIPASAKTVDQISEPDIPSKPVISSDVQTAPVNVEPQKTDSVASSDSQPVNNMIQKTDADSNGTVLPVEPTQDVNTETVPTLAAFAAVSDAKPVVEKQKESSSNVSTLPTDVVNQESAPAKVDTALEQKGGPVKSDSDKKTAELDDKASAVSTPVAVQPAVQDNVAETSKSDLSTDKRSDGVSSVASKSKMYSSSDAEYRTLVDTLSILEEASEKLAKISDGPVLSVKTSKGR